MAIGKLPEFTLEDEEIYKNTLEEPCVLIEVWGSGLRGTNHNDPAYDKWKEQKRRA